MSRTAWILVALVALATAAAAQERSWEGPYDRGVKAFQAGNYQEAVAQLERAVAIDSRCGSSKYIEGVFRGDYFPYYYLSATYLKLNQRDRAQENLARAQECPVPQSWQDRLDALRRQLSAAP